MVKVQEMRWPWHWMISRGSPVDMEVGDTITPVQMVGEQIRSNRAMVMILVQKWKGTNQTVIGKEETKYSNKTFQLLKQFLCPYTYQSNLNCQSIWVISFASFKTFCLVFSILWKSKFLKEFADPVRISVKIFLQKLDRITCS